MKFLKAFIASAISFWIAGEGEGMPSEEDRKTMGRFVCLRLYGSSIVLTWEANGAEW